MKDIKNTKEAVKLVISGFKAYKLAAADGKIGFEDLGHAMIMLPHIQPAFEGIMEVPAEFKDLNAEEASELSAFVLAELGDVGDKLEAIITASLGIVANSIKLYVAIKKPEPEVVA